MNSQTKLIHLIIGRLERYRRKNFPELITGKVDSSNSEQNAIAISDTTASLIEIFAGFEELNDDESLKKLHREILILCEDVDAIVADGRLADYSYALDLDGKICEMVHRLREITYEPLRSMTLRGFMEELCEDTTNNQRLRCVKALQRAAKYKKRPLRPPLIKIGKPKGSGKKGSHNPVWHKSILEVYAISRSSKILGENMRVMLLGGRDTAMT